MKQSIPTILAFASILAAACTNGTLPTGCEEFEVTLPAQNPGPTIRATDFGLSSSGTKNAAAINAALEECRRLGASRLELAPGTYRCFDEPGIVVEDLDDFTFDGKGAVLVFRRAPEYRCQPQSELILDKGNLGVRRCNRILIENFIMDWDWENDPLAIGVKVIGKHIDKEHGENSFVDLLCVNYDKYPKYPEPVPIQKLMGMDSTFTAFRKAPGHYAGQTEGHFGARNEWITPNVLRVWPGIPMEGRNQNPATNFKYSPSGNLAAVRKLEEGGFYRMQHCYYGKNGINLESNTHLTLKDVTVWSCFGMGLVVDGVQQYWQVENFRLVPPTKEEFEAAYPGRKFFERPMTSSSDGHHVARSKGWCKYIGCVFSRNNDDASNFHDRFTIAVRASDNVLDIINKRGADYFRGEAGAEIELRYPNYSPVNFRAKIEKIEGSRIYVDKALPRQKGQCFLVWDRTYGTDHVLLKGCRFIENSNRTIFSPSHLTVENCEFRRCYSLGMRIIADYQSDRWCEGFGASDIIVRGNTFEDTCLMRPEDPVFSTICVFPKGWEVGTVDPGFVGGHMLVENNRFIRPSGPAIELPMGDDVIIRNNVIDLRDNVRATERAGQIIVTTPGKVQVYGNTVIE